MTRLRLIIMALLSVLLLSATGAHAQVLLPRDNSLQPAKGLFSNDASKHKITALSNAQTGGGSYDLEITRGTSTGEQAFAHAGISVAAGDT